MAKGQEIMGKDARTFGQYLMRGEHNIGAKKQRLASVDCGPKADPTKQSHTSASASAMSLAGGFGEEQHSGTSIFDPVVCELAYRWFCPQGGQILDPFAGGSVRGIVASHLGRKYVGVELRREQVEANIKQLHIAAAPKPDWRNADSKDIARVCFDVQADMIFSCPPYADLEVYSNDPADLSNMDYAGFIEAYRHIIKETCSLLKDDSFACFVVGEVRDKRGNYRNFVGDTVSAFLAAGLKYYNEAILITAVGSLPVRVGRQFSASRKLGKTHQNVLVFVKGDPAKATRKII